MTLKLWPLIEYWIRNIFIEKSYRKFASKPSSRPLFILVNNPKQPLYTIFFFKNKIFWKRIIKNLLKSWLYFLFQTQSLLIDKVMKNKRGLELVTSCFSGYKTSSQKFLYYILSDQVWWCNIKWFLSYCKNYTCKFMQANSWHHISFHFHLSFWI